MPSIIAILRKPSCNKENCQDTVKSEGWHDNCPHFTPHVGILYATPHQKEYPITFDSIVINNTTTSLNSIVILITITIVESKVYHETLYYHE